MAENDFEADRIYRPSAVECYSGYKACERPVAFTCKGRRMEISEIPDRWYEGGLTSDKPVVNYFKVKTGEGRVFILRYAAQSDAWAVREHASTDIGGQAMSSSSPSRDHAWELLTRHNKSNGLIAHALAVESVMRHFAEQYGEDPDKWGIIGLVHDLDYEQYPDQHCHKTAEILRAEDWPEEYVRAVISHGYGIVNDVKPASLLEKTLYTIDELTGLVAAAALVRPSKSILDMKAKSVKKKWKDKRFAAGVNREIIEQGCRWLDMELSEAISQTIEGMKPVAEEIGLKGNPD